MTRVGIVAINSPSFIRCAFSTLKSRKTVVTLRNKNDEERVKFALVDRVVCPEPDYGWLNIKYEPQFSEEIAQISFTSGTEGTPKAILLSHKALSDVDARIIECMGLTSEIMEYIGVPVYHSFGYARCRVVSRVGGKAYIPENGFDPMEFTQMLLEKKINALSVVPSQLRLLLSLAHEFGDERKLLRWIEIGSQPMSKDEKILLRELFPEAIIMQHYGLTEASRTTFLRIDKTNASLKSVGSVTGDVKVKIGSAGRIYIKGPHVASGQIVDGRMSSILGDNGWLETGDLGKIVDGNLFFLGRFDNMINCGGQKISSEFLEEAISNKLGHKADITVLPIDDHQYGNAILIAKLRDSQLEDQLVVATAREIVGAYGVKGTQAIKLFRCAAFPLTSTGKVVRSDIAKQYFKYKQSKSGDKSKTTCTIEEELLLIFREAFDDLSIDGNCSVGSLHADSIVAVSIAMQLNRFIKDLPHNWRTLTIADLALLAKENRPTKSSLSNGTFASHPFNPLLLGRKNSNPDNIGFWALVFEDFKTHNSDFFSQGFWAVFVNRFGNWRMGVRIKIFRAPLTITYYILLKLIQLFCGIKLDYTVKLGRRVKLEHFGGMILGAREIGDDVIIRQNTTFGILNMTDINGKPIIEKGVNIGAGAVIVGDITVGRYSVIGANAVVSNTIPPYSIIPSPESIIFKSGKS